VPIPNPPAGPAGSVHLKIMHRLLLTIIVTGALFESASGAKIAVRALCVCFLVPGSRSRTGGRVAVKHARMPCGLRCPKCSELICGNVMGKGSDRSRGQPHEKFIHHRSPYVHHIFVIVVLRTVIAHSHRDCTADRRGIFIASTVP